jgi:hypothetical protein
MFVCCDSFIGLIRQITNCDYYAIKIEKNIILYKRKIPVNQVLPIKPIPSDVEKSKKIKQILVSIKELGIIEPVVVAPESGNGKIHHTQLPKFSLRVKTYNSSIMTSLKLIFNFICQF